MSKQCDYPSVPLLDPEGRVGPREFCEIVVDLRGQIMLRGEEVVVQGLISELAAAGFMIRWNYHSRCG